MTVLSSLSSSGAKPGASFSAKGVGGFTGKLHSAIEKNANQLGTLKHSPQALEALHAQVLKNQHVIRRGGLSEHQAHKLVQGITSKVHVAGGHLSAAQHEALQKLSHHLTKIDATKNRPSEMHHNFGSNTAGTIQNHAISSISSGQHTSSVQQIGDQTRVGADTPHAASGIASLMKNKTSLKNGPINKGGSFKPPTIKLSI